MLPHILLLAQLSAIAVIDLRRFIIPDALSAALLLTGLGSCWWYGLEPMVWRLSAAAAGFLSLYLVDHIYRHLRGRRGMGMGDAKLFAGSGAWVGLAGLPSVLLWAVASALAHAILLHLAGTRLKATRRIPFGPHLALGTALVWFLGPFVLA